MTFKKFACLCALSMVILIGCDQAHEPVVDSANTDSNGSIDAENVLDKAETVDDMVLTQEEEERFEILIEWGWTEEEVLRLIIEERLRQRLATPLDYHLTEEEATDTILRLIYEAFDVVVDLSEIPIDDEAPSRMDFDISFLHEDWSNDGRSFWLGNAIIYDVIYSDIRTLLHHFIFRIDGITGEIDMLSDGVQDELNFEPIMVEISWNGKQLTIVDDTRAPSIWDDPAYANRMQPYHPTLEEIGILIAEAVYHELGVDLADHFFLMHMTHFSEYTEWLAEIATEHDVCTSLAVVRVDAQTGEIRFIGDSSHSTDNPFSGCYTGNR